ncbi:MAG: arsenic resistance protein [Flavobacterium sp.]|nr:hypothetical protein [Spirochaetales bacterium]
MTKQWLEEQQIYIYIVVLILSGIVGIYWPGSHGLESWIEPVIGILLYSMFCQIPFLELKGALKNRSFFKALLFGNFILVPLLVWGLVTVFSPDSTVAIGIVLVLVTPCIDYVIVFTHMGKGDYKSVLASTPLLFALQMALLPIYMLVFLGRETIEIIELAPFVKSFLYLIVIPFSLSVLTQLAAKSRNRVGERLLDYSGWIPVPAMAMTFFVVVGSQVPSLKENTAPVVDAVPVYLAYAVLSPLLGKVSSMIFRVGYYGSRAVSFSTATRNSLVVLPLALSLPAPENRIVAAVIVTQTIIEILSELVYIKAIPILTRQKEK